MKKIVIIGDTESDNLGDPLLVYNFEMIIKKNAEVSTKVWDINNYSKKSNIITNSSEEILEKNTFKKYIHRLVPMTFDEYFYYRKNKINWLNFEDYLKKEKIDKIIFAGGQMFMSYYAHQIIDIIKIADKLNIEVFFNAIGVGSLKIFYIRKQLSYYLNKSIVKSVTVRDHITDITEICKKPVKLLVDSVAMSNLTFESGIKTDKVGIGVIYRSGKEKEINNQLSNVIKGLENANKDWEFFSNGSIEDFEFGIKILTELGFSEEKMASRPLTSEELIQTITQYSQIISYRLHSHIIAFAFSIPSFGLAWDEKVVDFFNLINQSNLVIDFSEDDKILSNIKNIDNWKVDAKKKAELISNAQGYIKEIIS